MSETEETNKWQPIETAPWDKWILAWWTPADGNPWAETFAKVQIMSPTDLHADNPKPTHYWDGRGEWPIELLTHWMPPPERPADRHIDSLKPNPQEMKG